MTYLLVCYICYSVRAIRLDTFRCHGRPPILINAQVNMNKKIREKTNLIKIHFLALTMVNEPLKIGLH